MNSIIKFSFYTLCFCLTFTAKAQLTYDNSGLYLGKETYTPLFIGNEWALDIWENGLNFWRAWPYPHSGNYKLFLDQTGKVGIGKKPSTYKLEVAGDVNITGTYKTTSDIRLKSNIQNLNNINCLDKIKSINGKSYNKKSYPIQNKEQEIQNLIKHGKINESDANLVLSEMLEEETKLSTIQFGFIAQELKEIFPELVKEDSNGYLSIDYMGLIPVIIEAMKEQQNIIKKQEIEIEELKEQNYK